MPKELVISAAPHETRVAILEDGQLCEIYIEREKEFALVGSIYKGRVTRVLPGMQSAFVDIGLDSDAFLYVGDFLENLEDYDHVVTTVEGKVQKMEQQGGEVFAPSSSSGSSGPEPIVGAEPASAESAPHEPVPPESPAQNEPPVSDSAQYAQPPIRETPPPAAPFARQERRPGGFAQNRRDQGRRGRGGRWRQGRELPPSKYASSRPYSPPGGQQREELPPDYEPVILPGESLAKYKDRIPRAAGTGSAGISASSASPVEAPPSAATPGHPGAAEHEADELTSSGSGERERQAAAPQEAWAPPHETDSPSATLDSHTLSEYQALPEEPPREIYEAAQPGSPVPSAGAHELSEEEVSSLAEQLAEARHEEVSSKAEADAELGLLEEEPPHAPESAAETDEFIAEAEAEEHEEESTELAPEAAAGLHEAGISEAVNAPERPMAARISEPQRARFQRPMRRGGRPRGQRQVRRPDHWREPRRPQLISEVLKPGQEIIVQIAKEPLGKKGARITSHVALPGRFLVYMPTVNHIGVSRRINSAEERSRLRHLVTEAKVNFPGGFIVRTAADGAPDEEIRSDVEFLGRTWEKIRAQGEPRKAPALLHRDLNLVERILRDYVNNDYASIWIDNEEEFSKVVEFVGRFQPKLVGRVKLYTKTSPIFEEFGIQQELDKALRPKVWLKSGGYIVINHTEALVAIDVNTGKYVGRGSTRLEDTIVKTNLEAVKEIIRQIRLRDLGGIIVLDFIDMEERRNREKVMAALEAALRSDRAPSKALAFNEFGLVAITRKRTKQALERVLTQPCPYCTGSGMVKSVPTICYEIQAEARKMAADLEASTLTLRVHPEIAKALKTREAVLVEELEQLTRKSVIIQADPTLHWEQYDIY
ncbi:MAG: ribonuclease [Acidobacteria bacterium]|nr:MAG: ribonuclease [Acidobacteriota bacterium]